jgi:hypothetical protein
VEVKVSAGKKKADAAAGVSHVHSRQYDQKHATSLPQPKGPPERAPTPEQAAHATVADLTLLSPAIVPSVGRPGRLAATYACDGTGESPELHWSGVPADSAELVLFAMNVQPVEGKLFVDWAVAGLSPELEEIKAGQLPKAAIVGRNGFGKTDYEICPEGSGEIYMFAIYALPQLLEPPEGFDGSMFRKEVLAASGDVGLLPAIYERG